MAPAAKFKQGDLAQAAATYEEAAPRNWIKIGMSTCGVAAGADPVFTAIREEVEKRGVDIQVMKTGCNGMCWAEPLVELNIEGLPRTMYREVDADTARELVGKALDGKQVDASRTAPGLCDIGFMEDGAPEDSVQKRVVLRNCGVIDPDDIEQYIARGGYQALERAIFELKSEGVIEELKKSGLRGRGGAGFPTWMKWSFCAKATGEEKFMLCNADEGDPGAYMDRSVLEGDPHAVIEGMLLGCLAIGAETGFFYIRAEYPLAIDRIQNAIVQARKKGLLGKDILGSGWNCTLEVRLGAGAFVCGEETALLHSIEGKRGEPRPRPPFPAQKGLWEQPSNINNVETLANIPPIIRNGGDWFAQWGTEKSKGTKVFALTGKVQRSGLVEIPMGTTLRQIVEDIGGGVVEGRTFKAVQTGGPSGGVIPADYLDTPISYESLQELGSIMGSGGMIVMDDLDSMVEIAKFYLGFTVEESCGKCAPCRIGGKQMLGLLEKIADGAGTTADIETLRRIARAMQKASLCALGQTAPNPVLSTLRYFGQEYDEKVQQPVAAS
ncbi:MAG: NADH-quinone oxidoreductase subunit NuoF [Planctomycetota bacterium]